MTVKSEISKPAHCSAEDLYSGDQGYTACCNEPVVSAGFVERVEHEDGSVSYVQVNDDYEDFD